jgi:lipid A disaccharide synthetase
MGKSLLEFLENPAKCQEIAQAYMTVHKKLRRNAAQAAAVAILDRLKK